MKSLREYLKESEDQYSRPVRGDNFAINIREECLLETYIVDETDDGIVLHADDTMMGLLESYGFLSNGDISQLEKDVAAAPVKPIASMEDQDVSMADAGEYDFEGDMAKDDLETIVRAARRLTGMLDDNENMPEWVQSKINKAADYVDTAADYIESNKQDYVSEDDSKPNPVARAVLNRILMQHPGVIATHGPQKVMDAIDELADYVNIGPDDEIGSSDVSAWTRDVIRMLAELPDEPLDEQGAAEGLEKNLSVQQLATISDEALDKAYGYGRSNPGNTFGWQANLMSAAYAKKMIDAGVTDIEKISDAIHKGWNVTAQKFVQNPDQFDDTEKLRQAGKLEAKLAQRAKLMKINYGQLDNEEQEKDRVVARALLKAIKGQQGMAEGSFTHQPRLDQRNAVEQVALHNRQQDYFNQFVEWSGKPMKDIYNDNDNHELAYKLENLGKQIAGNWRNQQYYKPGSPDREKFYATMKQWYDLYNSAYDKFTKEQGVAEGSGQYRVTLTLKDDSAGPGESATQRVNITVNAADEQSAIAQAKQKLIKSPRYSGSRIVGAKIQQGVAEGEDDLVDLGPALRNLTGEFNKFMKHDDRMKTDPAYAKKWNKRYAKYAGNDDHSIYDDPDDDKEQGVAEGLGDDNSIWNQYGHYTKQDLMKEFPNITPQDAQSIVNYAEYGWSPHVDAQKFRNEVVKRIKIAMGQQGMDEAKYQGREVPLGKPMKGDVKKSKVYVRGPKGNVVKVNFGQKGMKIKKNIPGRRKNFRARHNCDNPGPRWKARYWSCRAW